MTDPISDMLIRIKNALAARHETVIMPCSKVKESIAELLKKEGYIASAEKKGKRAKKYLEIGLLYDKSATGVGLKPKIKDLVRVSKSSRRVYQSSKDIVPAKYGYGVTVLSTPKGLMLDRDAKRQKVGGEVMFKIF
jgi:small subunit ribosomal protein S8